MPPSISRHTWLRSPFFAYLFTIYPVIFVYTYNLEYITAEEFLACLAGASALFVLLLFLGRLVFRDWLKSALATALCSLMITIYVPVDSLAQLLLALSTIEPEWIDTLVWLLLLLISIRGFIKILRRPSYADSSLPAFLNCFSLLLLLVCLTSPFANEIEDWSNSGAIRSELERKYQQLKGTRSSTTQNLPDIYYIILDGYGRADVLRDLYGFDNSKFLDFLRSKGFYVAEQSRANYIQTFQSLGSTLNLGYLDDLLRTVKETSVNRQVFQRLLRDNILFRRAQALGYQVSTISTGFDTTGTTNVDQRLKSPHTNALLGALLTNLKLPGFRREISHRLHRAHYEQIRFGFDQLLKVERNGDPRLLFAHILTPHPPFVFDTDGSFRSSGVDFKLQDGSDYGSRANYRENYIKQLQFANTQMQAVLEQLISRSSRPLIIIVQGDHGPGLELNWNHPRESNLTERFSILNAYYFSAGLPEEVKPDIIPANTFRIIANHYWGAELPLLSSRFLFSSAHRPFLFVDVTGRLPK